MIPLSILALFAVVLERDATFQRNMFLDRGRAPANSECALMWSDSDADMQKQEDVFSTHLDVALY